MRNLSDTISRLNRLRTAPAPGTGRHALAAFDFPGSNPGALAARIHIPTDLEPGAPLVVVLHGCTQTATAYDDGAGWSTLADRDRFAVLFPEQNRSNNGNLCFNWFAPEDTRRGFGEALSIRQMIDAMIARHSVDSDRIFITGLSAGGAMTAAMLVAYPELFEGGAVIAGLAAGAADSVPAAFDRMRGAGGPGQAMLDAHARSSSDHAGPWPRLSVWHGSADKTVAVSNMETIAAQARSLHGLDAMPTRTEHIDGHERRIWCDENGTEILETYLIAGLGHGTPIDPTGPEAIGRSAPYMLDAGIGSTERIARFWGISPAKRVDKAVTVRSETHSVDEPPATHRRPTPVSDAHLPQSSDVGRIIEDALRAAGLMR